MRQTNRKASFEGCFIKNEKEAEKFCSKRGDLVGIQHVCFEKRDRSITKKVFIAELGCLMSIAEAPSPSSAFLVRENGDCNLVQPVPYYPCSTIPSAAYPLPVHSQDATVHPEFHAFHY